MSIHGSPQTPGRGSPEQCALGRPVVCEFLTLCRTDCTTGVQVIWRVCSFKVGQGNKEGPSTEAAVGESSGRALQKPPRKEVRAGWALVSSLERQRKGFGDRFRYLGREEQLLPDAPLIASLLGALRVQESSRLRKERSELAPERVPHGAFNLEVLYLFQQLKPQGRSQRRILVDYSSVFQVFIFLFLFFVNNMLMCQNECTEGPESLSGSFASILDLFGCNCVFVCSLFS